MADFSKYLNMESNLEDEHAKKKFFEPFSLKSKYSDDLLYASDFEDEDDEDIDDDFNEEDEDLFDEDDLIDEGYEEDFDFDEEEEEEDDEDENFGRYN